MQVSEAIRLLDVATCGHYRVAVLCRDRGHATGEWGQVRVFDIVDVAVDDEDRDVNLVTTEHSKAWPARPLKVNQLLGKLQGLEEQCGSWSLYSRSADTSVSSRWEVRLDVPVVGVGTNHTDRTVGFLQFPEEQWHDAV